MEGTLFVFGLLIPFLIIQRKKMEKKEKIWVYSLSFLTAVLSLLFFLPFSINGIIIALNKMIGPITRMVVS